MTGTEGQHGWRARDADEREAALDAREADLDGLEESLGRQDAGRAAARAEARQARHQARQVRLKASQVRESSTRRRAETEARLGTEWAGRHPVGAEFAALAERLINTTDSRDAIEHVLTAATDVVPGVDVASITVLDRHGEFRTPVRTDELALQLDEAQYRAGEGPCVEATSKAGLGMARGDDLAAADTPWRRFSPSAVDLGMRSAVAVGLLPQSASPRLGALNLYAHEPRALVEVDEDVAVALAAYLAVTLVALAHVDSARKEVANLRRALENRDLIGQAKGIVMVYREVSADRAFELLSEASQRLNVKLRDVAEQVVRGRRL